LFPSAISPELWGIIHASNNFTIRQHVKLLPKHCCACPPCVKQENTYSIFAGLSQDASSEILRVDEVSDDWNRCCCAPYHPTRLEVRQYVPTPGDGSSTGTDHIQNEVFRDWDRFSARDRQRALHDYYTKFPVLMSILRDDGQRCCRFPCKCLQTWVCFPCCQDGVHLYAGSIPEAHDDEKGRYDITSTTGADSLIGRVIQPNYGGWYIPSLHLHDGLNANTNEPFGKVEGPCCFGGWSEFCFDFKFFVSNSSSPQHTGDIGLITKKKPSDAGGFIAELCSDADLYSIQFNEDRGLNAEQKLTVLAAQLLLDYMLFDGNTKKCENRDEAVYCYCFYCSLLGNVCPCYIAIPKKK
jgi:hypothetical protein